MLIPTKWVAADKQKHFLAGLLIMIVSNVIFGLNAAMILVIVAAILKEIYDDYHTHKFDFKDIYYTVLGGMLGVLIIELLK